MQTSYIWHKLHLYGKKITVFGVGIALCTAMLFAHQLQAQSTYNLPKYDHRTLHYGFQIGIQNSWLNVNHSQNFVNNMDSTTGILPRPTVGFSLGLIMNWSFSNDHWIVRINPNVSFYEHRILFQYANQPDGSYSEFDEIAESTFIEFPLLIKHRSLRRHNHRFYMIAGVVPAIKVGGRRQKLDPLRLGIEDYNFEITYGLGLDYYMSFFKFAPEIRFTHGMSNMLYRNGSSFGRNIERLSTHRISLYLNFE
ncbi:MAG: PorT family protein [Bernardetiaceae bacterium]|nr:PorT family protein [Bernardetiaceae bacterium]